MVKKVKSGVGRPCPYCGRKMEKAGETLAKTVLVLDCTATIEHIIPRSNGGTDDPINLMIVCRRCNNLRGSIPYAIFEVFARHVLKVYPNASTILLRRVLQDFVWFLAEAAINNNKAVKSSIRLTLLSSAVELQQTKQ